MHARSARAGGGRSRIRVRGPSARLVLVSPLELSRETSGHEALHDQLGRLLLIVGRLRAGNSTAAELRAAGLGVLAQSQDRERTVPDEAPDALDVAEDRFEALAVDEGHRVVDHAVGLAVVEHADDIGVVEGRGRASLDVKAAHVAGIGAEPGVHDLEGDPAAQ